MTQRNIDFWFSIGSTYSYLSVMRIGQLAADRGFTVHWHPFSVRQLMREMDNIPFAEAKGEGIGEAYEAATAAARALGIFGSPNFVIDRELFWGDDRLDDAIAWLDRAQPQS